MSYEIDFSSWDLDFYKNILKISYLIPSQRVLLESIDEHFEILKKEGIDSAEDLIRLLKNKKAVAHASEETGIPEKYLSVLKRELFSRKATPRKLEDYPTISTQLKKTLANMNIYDSRHFYEYVQKETIEKCSLALEIEKKDIDHAARLVNITRLRYVSPLFATVLVLSAYDSIKTIQNTDPKTLYDSVRKTNKEKMLYRAY